MDPFSGHAAPGPYWMDELDAFAPPPPDPYTWYAGMRAWVEATEAAELRREQGRCVGCGGSGPALVRPGVCLACHRRALFGEGPPRHASSAGGRPRGGARAGAPGRYDGGAGAGR